MSAAGELRPGDRPETPLVAVENLEVAFRTRRGLFGSDAVRAVDKVSLAVGRGETVALVGESGSGKTTLGRATLRLVQADAGRVLFDGRDITDEPEGRLGWLRRRAQMVFQDPFSTLNPYMRVGELVEEPLVIAEVRSRSERRDRALRALEAVELVPAARVADKYPTTMSGGQRQRVGIARALVRDPEYIVADEPVSMIDASSRIEILDLLRNLQLTRRVAFLYITHDIASARHFADRIAVMYRGAVVELGSAGAVVDRPVHPYTQALIAAVPEPDPRNRLRRRATRRPTQEAAARRLHPDCPHGDPPVGSPLLLGLPEDQTHFIACHSPVDFAG
ncbi:MAG: ATP-binding cassette domain-containing protein [Chloroflexota bacterium]|nr:ATP-binding cassette domain-containing protein [Chloroflexota bacterium]